MRFTCVPQRLIGLNSIPILSANFFAFDESARFKIGDDPLHGTLGDSHLQRDLPEHQ